MNICPMLSNKFGYPSDKWSNKVDESILHTIFIFSIAIPSAAFVHAVQRCPQ